MLYEYRKLTPEEQAAVVEARRQHGFPLHSPPHPFRESGTYLLTAANFEHTHIMSTPERRTGFQSRLLCSLQDVCAEIIGWVILPNHYHVLLTAERLEPISAVIKQVHGQTSRQWNAEDGLTGKRKVWYHFADRVIRNEQQPNQSLNYIHWNPLKHKLVQAVYEWPWSSLGMYEEEKGREWLRQQWKEFQPPLNFGDQWDD